MKHQASVQPHYSPPNPPKTKPRTENLILDLPEACQRGQKGNRHKRGVWVKEKTAVLEQQPGAKVVGFSYLEDKIMFQMQYTVLPTPPPTLTDLSTNALRANPSSSSQLVKTQPSPDHAVMKVTLPIATRPMADSPLPKVKEAAISTQVTLVLILPTLADSEWVDVAALRRRRRKSKVV